MTTQSGTQPDYGPVLLLFFLTLFVGGLLGLDFLPEWRAQTFYVEGRCVLLDKRLVEESSRGSVDGTYRPEFFIRYTVDGREHWVWAYKAVRSSSAARWPKERVLERFTLGREYPCWYDPDDPSQVVVVQGYSWFSYVVGAAFLVLVYFTGRGFIRAKRRARCAADKAGGVAPDRPNEATQM